MEYSTTIWSWLCTTGFLALLTSFIYLCLIYSYWERKRVPFVKAKWFLGSFGMRWDEPEGHIEKEWYREHGKVFGIYEGMTPVLMVADPELIKNILVRDFSVLPNQRVLHVGCKILDKMIINLEGNHWRRVRSATTPLFSTSKVKKMSHHIKKAVSCLEDNLKVAAESKQSVNCVRYFNTFTMDTISRCAFDVIINDNDNPNNPFVRSVENLFSDSLPWRTVLYAMFPRICEWVKLSVVDAESVSFFNNAVLELLEHRRSNPTEHHDDFLQFMLNCSSEEGKESSVKRITQDEVIAQCVLFFIVGFTTTAATLGYAAYSLAIHSECQEKLYKEITEVLKDKEEVDYDDVQKMKYLEAVISETLRYYTPVPRVDRRGEEDYVLGDTGIVVPKGMMIGIPIYALHHDPDWFPEPEKFIPDRFLQDSGHKIRPYTYLPFGVGPRNCLGMKFAQMELKMCLANVFRRFRFSATPESKITTNFGNGLGVHRPVEAIVRIEQRCADKWKNTVVNRAV